ncbi:MAG: PAS domain S-box protein, partial [Chloroflexota bacterium]|nr:PAS domain S-box protein [Chloroflexota bacterium]
TGKTRDMSLTVNMIPGTKQSVASLMDITERKQAERALLESEHKYRALFENGLDGVVIIGETMKLLLANQAAADIAGFDSVEELLEANPLDFIVPEDRERFVGIVAKDMFVKNLRQVNEFRCVKKSGEEGWISAVGAVIEYQGKMAGLASFRDITWRKRAEAEKRSLEQRAMRASQLASVGEMASGVAHEINNPLTGVIGFAQLLMREELPEDIREQVETIHEGAQRVAGIVKGLLTFARQHKAERTYADINQLIETTLNLRTYSLRTGNIEVERVLDPDLPRTMADAGQLQQVFMNLVANAESEMSRAHGRGKLVVTTGKAGGRIKISFMDNGPGIARGNLVKIFQPFFTTKDVGKGTGLGLSVCHGIIEEHDGRIWAESKKGKGATFTVELPVVAQEMTQEKLVEQAKPSVTGGRILVVDDEAMVRSFLERVLTRDGYEVETVDTGEEGLARIQEKRYRAILLDIKMPGKSGVELYREIRGIASSLAGRVIFITGDVMGTDTQEFLSRTHVPHIPKPIDVGQLRQELGKVVNP